LADAQLSRRLGVQARETICQRFTAVRMAEETLRVYREASGLS